MQLTPSKAGLVMIFLTLPVLFCPIVAGKLVSKGVPSNLVLFVSLFAFILGGITLSIISQPEIEIFLLAAPLFLIGVGMGLSAGLVDGLALSSVKPSQAGMAAGLLNTLRLGSEAIAVALYASLLTSFLNNSFSNFLSQFKFLEYEQSNWVNEIASGNFSNIPKSINGDSLLIYIQNMYHQSFISVLDIINILIIVLSVFIAFLLSMKPRLKNM